jgi:anthranilate synthase component 2
MKILLLDNYDSFTFNLLHLVEQFDGVEVDVFRNDEITVDEAGRYDRFVVSPGPGLPDEAGITKKLIERFYTVKPILGVCLGMQAMTEVCGGRLFNLTRVFHGVAEETFITDANEALFKGINSPFKCGRYHSWGADAESLPSALRITAIDRYKNIMALTHENQLLRGVQFHPESILTEFGKTLISNWLLHC